jgi:hypothetical protein
MRIFGLKMRALRTGDSGRRGWRRGVECGFGVLTHSRRNWPPTKSLTVMVGVLGSAHIRNAWKRKLDRDYARFLGKDVCHLVIDSFIRHGLI